ncbi:hypothetical protein Tco_1490852 [Tanacetum coccineum]
MEQPHLSDAHKITLADQLVNPRQYQAIGKCNNKEVLLNIPFPKECRIVGQLLVDHAISYALTATADVPACMRTRSQSRNSNRQRQQVHPTFVEPFNLVEPIENQAPPIVTMADNRTMAQFLEAPTEGYEDAIVVPKITAENLELKHGLLTLVQNKQFFGHDKEDPHAHIRYFNKITSTMKFPNITSTSVKLMLFPFSLEGAARIWLEKEPPRSILTWDDLVNQPPAYQALAYQAPAPQTQGVSKTDFESYVKANDAVMQNMQSQMYNITDLLTKIANSNAASTSGSGSLPSNTISNPKGELKAITTRSGASYDGPQVPPPTSSLPKVVENEPEVTKDSVPPTNNGSTKDVQPTVVQVQPYVPNSEPVVAPVSAPMPNLKPSIPYPLRRNDEKRYEKANDQIEKFYEIFKDLSFEISLTDALILMPKFASTLKVLIGNKEKLRNGETGLHVYFITLREDTQYLSLGEFDQ